MIRSPNLPDTGKANIESIHHYSLENSKISLDVLRLDKIHTIISGNKWFKLKYYLEECVTFQKKGIITLGGAYSNHLIAVAYACNLIGLSSIGIIRGEQPTTLSPTLIDIQKFGMQVEFAGREMFYNSNFVYQLKQKYSDYFFVDEGGRGVPGIRGAEEILQLAGKTEYTHIICAVGTGTMITGIINAATERQWVIGIPVLKLGQKNTVSDYILANTKSQNFVLEYDFHFGGYAKSSKELLHFINLFYFEQNIPLDFVYTGKLFFAVMKLAGSGYFPKASRILVVHSGGLQGNRSLPAGKLAFCY